MSAMDWAIENERLTVFWDPSAQQHLWAQVVGGDPDRSETQKSFQATQETRALADGNLVVLNSPGRTDFLIQAGTPLGSLSQASLDEYRALVDAWVGRNTDPIVRIALGRVHLKQVVSREEGYKEIKPLLKSVSVSPEMFELLYQVNWMKPSTVDSTMKLNRVTKWAVVEFQNFVLVQPGATIPLRFTPNYCSRLEIDISTPVNPPTPKLESIPARLEEMKQLMLDIQQNGEPVC